MTRKNNKLVFFAKIRQILSCMTQFLEMSREERQALDQIEQIGQREKLFAGWDKNDKERLQILLDRLVEMDRFYREIGGIAGYQKKVLSLLKTENNEGSDAKYHAPSFIDITDESKTKEAVQWGLSAMPHMAEIYPLGGAADRLHLVDDRTGQDLPAAKLPFAGRMLLEHLIRDLEGREKLFEQKYGKKIVTPIAIMTSHEKNNHAHVLEILEEKNWFGRPKDSIRLFTQPLVPAVDEEGNWCLLGPLKPLFKPGGHGAIWKMAKDSGCLQWLEKLGRTHALVRQINNPIAGLDYGLLAFTGIGWKNKMKFGFASCPRLLQAAEGVNVLVEKEGQIALTNIEYCDFAKFGIEDKPLKVGEPYSRFSSNTNILFVNLKAISDAVEKMPFPGLLLNLKKTAFTTENGVAQEKTLARLESTMQNIADVFTEPKGSELKTKHTYLTYNVRHKTISTAKKAYVAGKPLQETPENCFYDLLLANRELLTQCKVHLPPERTLDAYMKEGPEFVFLYHPILGPLYSTIREKILGGKLFTGSELLLEIADVSLKNLSLNGSLQIISEEPLHGGRCQLKNVTIENLGVDWSKSSPFWKMKPQTRESVKIILKRGSQFIAENTTLKGSHTFIVEDGQTLRL